MKMAKPSERDIDAAGNLMSLLHQIDRGDYPNLDEDADVPDFFDVDSHEHLRAFYDAVMGTLEKAPGYPGRVIGGMCYVIMYGENEIVDPASGTLDLHPKLVKALELAEATQAAPEEVRNQPVRVLGPGNDVVSAGAYDILAERRRQVEAEGWTPSHDDAYEGGELAFAAACYATAGDPPHHRAPDDWPWDQDWWKPADDRRNLVKAGALILADIERIDRALKRTSTDQANTDTGSAE